VSEHTGEWTSPYPFDLVALDPDDDAEWAALLAAFGRQPIDDETLTTDRPLARCFEVARANRAQTLVVETRYVDLDYRSEFSAFYSKAFESFEDTCQRLHFFATPISATRVLNLTKAQRDSYLGYVVLRPRVRAVVGRTMLCPPADELKGAVRTAVRERVAFFGQEVEVKAVPFMQQDARLGSCAHVAIWMCHYSAYRAEGRVARQPVAEFSLSADTGLGLGRIMPTPGLTLNQMSDILSRTGLPPIYYEVSALTDEDRPDGENWLRLRNDKSAQLSRVCCRYLNSGLPVIAVIRHIKAAARARPDFDSGSLHAVLVCGYYRDGAGVCLVAHDDRRGPYLTYKSVTDDFDPLWSEHVRWDDVLAPVPQKLWLTGEAAERAGCEYLVEAARTASADVRAARSITKKFGDGQLSFRAYAITGTRFKLRIAAVVSDPVVLRAYREARLPHYVWVVEAIDRRARDRGTPECVLGEVVYDATSDAAAPRILASRLPGVIEVVRPDVENPAIATQMTGARQTVGQYGP
jgi:hypothetical protein